MENNFEIKYYVLLEVLVFIGTNQSFKEQFFKLTNDEISQWIDEKINNYTGNKLDVEKRKLTNEFLVFCFADISQ